MTTTSGSDPVPGRYFGRLVLHPLDGDLYELDEPFGYCTIGGDPWPVPAGFRTDGASIPRLLWRCIGHPFRTAYVEAAVVHDYLYSTQLPTRRYCDAVFHEAMLESGCSAGQAWAMWFGVRVGGWYPWRLHADRNAQRIGRSKGP